MTRGQDDPGESVWRAIRQLVRERLARTPGGHLVESRLRTMELQLPVELAGRGAGQRFARRLVAAIDTWIDDAVQQAAAFRPGHAYCHRCRSPACEHSRPPSSRHVFIGYAATGLPRWEDFAQRCLDLQHPKVDQLYDDPPALVTLLQDRGALQRGMLRAFRTESHDLIGQLTAGFFPVHSAAAQGRGVLALTVQVAAFRSRTGPPRLGLNLLGRTPGGDDLERLWERHEELPWRRSLRWAQNALETVVTRGRPGRGGSPSDEAIRSRVEGILQSLSRRLERDQRSRSRRTRHAERRHASGQRPTGKAVDDARAAGDGQVLQDERSGTLVVLGDRGRTHFFTSDGQHVSSVRYRREAIERKVKLELWRPASSEQKQALRSRLPAREDSEAQA